jgi:hypothetical protein
MDGGGTQDIPGGIDLGYPAQPGLIGESVHPIRLRLCTNIVIYATASQMQTRCHINHSIIIV